MTTGFPNLRPALPGGALILANLRDPGVAVSLQRLGVELGESRDLQVFAPHDPASATLDLFAACDHAEAVEVAQVMLDEPASPGARDVQRWSDAADLLGGLVLCANQMRSSQTRHTRHAALQELLDAPLPDLDAHLAGHADLKASLRARATLGDLSTRATQRSARLNVAFLLDLTRRDAGEGRPHIDLPRLLERNGALYVSFPQSEWEGRHADSLRLLALLALQVQRAVTRHAIRGGTSLRAPEFAVIGDDPASDWPPGTVPSGRYDLRPRN